VGFEHADRLWVRGGFPKPFLARSDHESMEWRQSFILIFRERDLPALGVKLCAAAECSNLAAYSCRSWMSGR